jgi:capsular polysaccharide export protein
MRILILQGNATPFFPRLGEELAARGHDVRRIALNGGDLAFWTIGRAIPFRRHPARWPEFLARVFAETRTDAILLFGQWRPMHRQAIDIAQRLGIVVWIFDEAYIRPHRIRMELAGPDGASTIPATAEELLARAARLPAASEPPPSPDSFPQRAAMDIVYHTVRAALWPAYPRHRLHTLVSPFREYCHYAWKFTFARLAARLARPAIRRTFPAGSYMLYPMQLDGDFQLRVRSRFGGNLAAIGEVLASFAAHAPADCRLLLKLHPLDPGIVDWHGAVAALGERHGVAERIGIVDGEQLPQLIAGARGVITINSTAAVAALEHGCPVLALGEAVYAMAGLTHQGGLDGFWRHPTPPDQRVVEAFRRVVVAQTSVDGGYFSHAGRIRAASAAADRIEAEFRTSRIARRGANAVPAGRPSDTLLPALGRTIAPIPAR